MCIVTVASELGDELWKEYKRVFTRLGLKNFTRIDSEDRDEKSRNLAIRALERAGAVFITGGDQLKITSGLGGTLACARIQEIYEQGGVIGGTSAGASVMSETMMVSGNGDDSPRGMEVQMAPGLGFTRGIIVDQHFAQRGRLGRLIAAVGLNPKFLGMGIDENTAVVFETPFKFQVIGAGGVYILDGFSLTSSTVSEKNKDAVISMTGLTLHVLGKDDTFDLASRTKIIKQGRSNRKKAPALLRKTSTDATQLTAKRN